MASARFGSKFAQWFNSETGPKTVHTWAPVLKWSLVVAGINDMQRPVEKISSTQQIALFATGAIWTRWCFIIKPRNMMLASVNSFLGLVAAYQLTRVFSYQRQMGFSVQDSLLNMAKNKSGPAEVATPVEASAVTPTEK